MTIQPTVEFSFSPSCEKCSCFGGSNKLYPSKKGKFKPIHYMTDSDVRKANERFRTIIARKLDPLPLDTDEFIDRLENEEGVTLEVSRENPLTKERLDDTVKAINRILRHMQID